MVRGMRKSTYIFAAFILSFITAGCTYEAAKAEPAAAAGTFPAGDNTIRLIVRGDDMGMTHAANEAVKLAFDEGILTSVSVLVPSPWFEEAARMCRDNPSWCVGVHLCVNAEWRDYRWRPVTPWPEVSSIVDEDGYFYPTAESFMAAGPVAAEVEKELRAQVELALKRGLEIRYLDTHMDSLEKTQELKDIVNRIARDYRLPVSSQCGEDATTVDIYNTPPGSKEADLAEKLGGLRPGLYLLVIHPGLDTPEERALVDSNPEGLPNVAANRDAEVRAITSPAIKMIIRERGIVLTDYVTFRDRIRGRVR